MTSNETRCEDPGWRALCEAAGDLAETAGARAWAVDEGADGAWRIAPCGSDVADAEGDAKRIIDLSVAAFEAPTSQADPAVAREEAVLVWPLPPRRALVFLAPAPTPALAACRRATVRLAAHLADWTRTELALCALSEGFLLTDKDLRVKLATAGAARLLGASGTAVLEGALLRELDVHWPLNLPESGEVVRVHLAAHPVSSIVHTLTDASRAAVAPLSAALVVRLRGDAVFKDAKAQQIHLMSALRHDVRSPLTAVRGLVAVLIDEPDIPREERLSLLELLRQESERTVTWVEDYLIMLRLRLDPGAQTATSCDVGPWLLGLESFFASHCASRGIALRVTSRPAIEARLAIAAEPALLAAFGRNLLGHALRLADEGAHVQLSVDPTSGALTLHAVGPGLFGREHEHPFTTLARSTASGKRTPGVGLGLFLVKRIADVYGWPLVLTASADAGLRLVIRWPAVRVPAAG